MNRRLIAAFLIAPLITSAVFASAMPYRAVSVKSVAIIFLLYTGIAYATEAVLGLPTLLIYRFFHWRSVVAYGVGGMAIGFLAMSLVAIIYSPFSKATPGEFVLPIVAGAAAGLAFRLIAGEHSLKRRVITNGEI